MTVAGISDVKDVVEQSGERRLAHRLRHELGTSAIVLSDRVAAGTARTVDHVVIAASGVWIVDAKDYAGVVERRNAGGPLHPDRRLYIASVDRTKLVAAMDWQHDVVMDALEAIDLTTVPVHRALCFVNSDWPARPKAFTVDGVWVTWPSRLIEMIDESDCVDRVDIEAIAAELADRLPAVPRPNERRHRA
jgi:hypothetical protein